MNALAMTLNERPTAEHTLDSSVAARGTLSEPSHTPVPLKPTAVMLAAGSRAGGVSVETAWKIYLAMINEAA
ncbi:hypothetical protein [Azospirillum soli]|uniref:hypothetical protein n=1 Tax=Azospirillum soli TaxID=1304799 RepID=UPI001AE7B32E|nr:hypothetical protein [Azospirillum soli]MBP2313366.1 hypothetical protein [Azospirillum soli]